MGPQLLLDKSSLQSLSYRDTWSVARHYYLVYAPVLFIEILGDLKLHADDSARSKKIVGILADKLQPGNSIFAPHHQALVIGNLMGYDIEMKGRPPLLGGTDIVTSTGEKALLFDEEPEREALRRWKTGEFLEAEHILSKRWRESTRSIDLEVWRTAYKGPSKASNLEEVRDRALTICLAPSRQIENLQFLINQSGIHQDQATLIYKEWIRRGTPILKDYAPYAFFCLWVYVTFYLGLANQLIGSRSTNRVDLEYLLYLPFCKAFVSGDKFHSEFIPLFLRSDQSFTEGKIFKSDIARISLFWDSLSETERQQYRHLNGSYPPDFEGSVTNNIWKRHMRPRAEYEQPLELTPEREKAIMEHLGPYIDAMKKLKEDRS